MTIGICEREQMLFLECARTSLPLSIMRNIRRYLDVGTMLDRLKIYPARAMEDEQMRRAFLLGCIRQYAVNADATELEYVDRK